MKTITLSNPTDELTSPIEGFNQLAAQPEVIVGNHKPCFSPSRQFSDGPYFLVSQHPLSQPTFEFVLPLLKLSYCSVHFSGFTSV